MNFGLNYIPLSINKLNHMASYRFHFNGKETDNEVYGEGNAYDFGDRMYNSRIGRWMSPDKLAREYAPISPYVISLNNPLIFRDADGNYVIGSDGKPVTYTQGKNGQIKWSSNATADVKKIGEAMLKTEKGKQVFDKMVASRGKVHLKYSEKALYQQTPTGKYKLSYGMTESLSNEKLPDGSESAKTIEDIDGTLVFEEVEITIYGGTFKAAKGDMSAMPEGTEMKDIIITDPERMYLGTEEEMLNGVGTHEGTHFLTTPDEVAKGKTDFEKTPNREENKSRKQYNKLKKD